MELSSEMVPARAITGGDGSGDNPARAAVAGDGDGDSPSTSRGTQESEVVWNWKRESMHDRMAGINHYQRLSKLDLICTELRHTGDKWYEALVASELGHFFLIRSNSYFSTAAVHQMLLREVTRAGRDDLDVFWFKIGPSTIRFSQYEYALVTGLKFGHCEFNPSDCPPPPDDGVYFRTILPIKEKMTVHDLSVRFSEGRFRQHPEDNLKVAKILLIYYILFGVDDRQTVIDRWIWTIIKDPEEFDRFPWGNYTYQILGHYLRTAPTSLDGRRSYHIYGPLMAFAIWACEAVPSLGNMCGEKLDINHRHVPRCVRWHLMKTNKSFVGLLDNEIECYETLVPTTEEQGAAYWRDVGIDIRAGLPQYVPRVARGDRALGQQPRKRKRTVPSASEPRQAPPAEPIHEAPQDYPIHEAPQADPIHEAPQSDPIQEAPLVDPIHEAPQADPIHEAPPTDPIHEGVYRSPAREHADTDTGSSHGQRATSMGPEFQDLKDEVAGLKSEMAGLKEEVVSLKNDMNSKMSRIEDLLGKILQNTVPVPPRQSHQSVSRPLPHASPHSCREDLAGNLLESFDRAASAGGRDEVITIDDSHILDVVRDLEDDDIQVVRRRFPSAALRSPYMPDDRRPLDADLAEFKSWLSNPNAAKRNVGTGSGVGPEWFREFMDPKVEMATDHMQAYLGLLQARPDIRRLVVSPDWNNRFGFVDPGFLDALKSIWNETHSRDPENAIYGEDDLEDVDRARLEYLLGYVRGELPNWPNMKPWTELDSIFTVWHPGTVNHWIPVRIDLKDMKFGLWDYFSHRPTTELWEARVRESLPVRRMLGSLHHN